LVAIPWCLAAGAIDILVVKAYTKDVLKERHLAGQDAHVLSLRPDRGEVWKDTKRENEVNGMSNQTYYENVFSVEEVAKILKIPKRYIIKLIREGKFGAMKIGKEYRVPKSVVDSFFNEALTAPYPLDEYGFGVWADRVDLPEDSVEYVNKIRKESDKKDLPDIINEAEASSK
jgi:excisionase family DNA binding protein